MARYRLPQFSFELLYTSGARNNVAGVVQAGRRIVNLLDLFEAPSRGHLDEFTEIEIFPQTFFFVFGEVQPGPSGDVDVGSIQFRSSKALFHHELLVQDFCQYIFVDHNSETFLGRDQRPDRRRGSRRGPPTMQNERSPSA